MQLAGMNGVGSGRKQQSTPQHSTAQHPRYPATVTDMQPATAAAENMQQVENCVGSKRGVAAAALTGPAELTAACPAERKDSGARGKQHDAEHDPSHGAR